MEKKIRVTVWNEFRHEKSNSTVGAIYPDGLHKTIADGIAAPDKDGVVRLEKRRCP